MSSLACDGVLLFVRSIFTAHSLTKVKLGFVTEFYCSLRSSLSYTKVELDFKIANLKKGSAVQSYLKFSKNRQRCTQVWIRKESFGCSQKKRIVSSAPFRHIGTHLCLKNRSTSTARDIFILLLYTKKLLF